MNKTDKTPWTPGPWEQACPTEPWDVQAENGSSSAITLCSKRHGWPVAAVCWGDWDDEAEHEANARLIAAAPEMAELLERLVSAEGARSSEARFAAEAAALAIHAEDLLDRICGESGA